MSLSHSQSLSHSHSISDNHHIFSVNSTNDGKESCKSYTDSSEPNKEGQEVPLLSSSVSSYTLSPSMSLPKMNSQNELLMQNLMQFYSDPSNMDIMIKIINGESSISLRIIDWFATNYAKKHFTVYDIKEGKRFKVYIDYKLKLKAYSKKRFDPFCRWERISVPYNEDSLVQTTLGQLNFFKWAIENKVIQYIEENYSNIERDMNSRNSTAKNNNSNSCANKNKTRKKREELSISAAKSIKKENVHIKVTFN